MDGTNEEVKDLGTEATEDELQPLEAAEPAEVDGTETAVPGDEDGLADENTFNAETV